MQLKYHELDNEYQPKFVSRVDNRGKKGAIQTEKLVCRWVRDDNNKLCCQWEVIGYFN
jgi:hypothetical protein